MTGADATTGSAGHDLPDPTAQLEDAADVLHKLASTLWGVHRAQSPAEACARANVTLVRSRMSSQGMYRQHPHPVVHLRDSLSRFDVPFVVFHELGHHLLRLARTDSATRRAVIGIGMQALDRIDPGSEEEELACDMFAASMLIDFATVEHWRTSYGAPSMAVLVELSAYRKVPVPLVFWRVRRLLALPWSMASLEARGRFDALTVLKIVGSARSPLAIGWQMCPDSPPLIVANPRAASRSYWQSPTGSNVWTGTGTSAARPGGGAYLLLATPVPAS